MRSEELLELSRALMTARKIAMAANVLYKLKIAPKRFADESISSATIEILLKLARTGGRAALSSLTVGNTYQRIAILRELEKNKLVKILETPFRTYVVLTERGWEVFNELVNILI